MKHFAVFGFPISHSLSPQIHAAFAAQLGIELSYERLEVKPGELKDALVQFKQKGGFGANITVPLKHEAYDLCQSLSSRAKQAQAVNTLGWNAAGELWGDNTDGEGLVRDLVINQQLTLTAKRILILGAGGATAGILAPLLSFSPTLVIVNRDLKKAQAMVQNYPGVKALSYEGILDEKPFDYIINATSASLQNAMPPIAPHLLREACCVDLAYRKNELTPFLTWAKAQQAAMTLDGLGMLVEQAALGFALWHGKQPQTAEVLKVLRAP
ncbi:MAG: shikimate dehydrogenase [Candidatus Berkiella sp.]